MRRRTPNRRETGKRYEEKAASFLERRGYVILERNYGNRFGEIDLVAEEEGCLVFVEVKYRRDRENGYPEEAVTPRKQERIRRAASWYLCRRGYKEETPCRFDVVSIAGEEISLFRDAF